MEKVLGEQCGAKVDEMRTKTKVAHI
uniref:Uncharacterized protein n=1 Tax=Rhizophora mucronata TaxID=61149 RepID=A0A2P2QWF0_RHIMU